MKAPGPGLIAGTMALLTLIWGSTWAVVRLSLEGFPPLTGVALRFILAALVLALWARASGRRLGGDRRLALLWPAQAVLTYGIPYGLVYWAEQWVPSGLTSVLFSTFPLCVAGLAYLLLPEERLRALGLAGIVLGFTGVAVIFSEDFALLGGARVARASSILLLAPISAAIAQVALKRWGKGLDAIKLTAVPMLLSGLGMGLLAAAFEAGRPIVLAPVPVAALLFLALVGSALTFSLYFWLLGHIPATRLSLIAFGMPVIAMVVGTLALDEPLTARTVAGAALVIAGVAVTLRERPRLPPPDAGAGPGAAAARTD